MAVAPARAGGVVDGELFREVGVLGQDALARGVIAERGIADAGFIGDAGEGVGVGGVPQMPVVVRCRAKGKVGAFVLLAELQAGQAL